MSDLKPKVGEWWVCEHISIMGNGDSISAYKMTPGLIIAGNVKPIERLYSKQEHDRMVEEIAELREALKSSQQVMNTFGLIHGNGKFSKNEKCQRASKLIENHMDDIFIANKNLLAKLNQEGGE